MSRSDNAIPVTILTGFLGAGKTTLLNRILHADHGLRVAVIVNDFGAVNIDSQLVADIEGEMVSMSNGCICCTIREDLFRTAEALISQDEPPEYILIEPSGVSDPGAIARTFLMLRPAVRIDGIVTVVDAEQFENLSPKNQVLAINQIGLADIILLNKCDLVERAAIERVKASIRHTAPRARILETVNGEAPLELLLGVGNFDPDSIARRAEIDVHVHPEAPLHSHNHDDEHEHSHDHSLLFSTWHYQSDAPLSIKPLRRFMKRLPTGIFRVKGFVRLHELPERRGLLQMTGSRGQLTFGEQWGDLAPRTDLVFIGEPGAIAQEELQELLERCRPENVNGIRDFLEDAVEWVRTL